MKSRLLLFAAFTFLTAAALAADEKGFVPLFNGKNTVTAGEHGVDLVTEKSFWNFTVKYEYNVPDKSNSGFYLRERHEIKILGDYDKGETSTGGNGAIYAFKAPDVFVSKPGGEWQTLEATIIGNKISVVLNGKKIHDNVRMQESDRRGDRRQN